MPDSNWDPEANPTDEFDQSTVDDLVTAGREHGAQAPVYPTVDDPPPDDGSDGFSAAVDPDQAAALTSANDEMVRKLSGNLGPAGTPSPGDHPASPPPQAFSGPGKPFAEGSSDPGELAHRQFLSLMGSAR